MKQQSIKPGVLALALVLLTVSSQAQSIYFNYTNGTNASYLLEDVRKITFDNDVMNLHFLDGTLYAWNVSTIGYYQYEESALGVEEVLGRGNAWQNAPLLTGDQCQPTNTRVIRAKSCRKLCRTFPTIR